jgi:hypothetical protein
VIILLTGVGLKVTYISFKIIRNGYRPGVELFFLFSGLILFYAGLHLSPQENTALVSFPNALRLTGVMFKILFIVLFIRKIKQE